MRVNYTPYALVRSILIATLLVFVSLGSLAQVLPLQPVLGKLLKNPNSSPDKLKLHKINQDLLTLYTEYSSHNSSTNQFQSKNPAIRLVSQRVLVDIIAENNSEQLEYTLKQNGLINSSRHDRTISGWFPITMIPSLQKLDNLRFVRPAYVITHIGLTTSQGDEAILSDVARNTFNVDGTGIVVGTLSDSYNCLGGAATDVVNGDLPTGVILLEEGPNCGTGTDEGRAMMQIIADVAPGANQAFHTAFGGTADFANGIIELATIAGADVIVDDVLFLAEPMFQDGIIAQAVDTVAAMGVSYFSSAGNSASNSYESAFSGSGSTVFGVGEAHDFDPGAGSDVFQNITVPVGATLTVTLQWDSPFFSVSGAPGSSNDIDIFLTDEPATVGVAGSQNANTGSDPVEIMSFFNDGSLGTSFNIVIEGVSGTAPLLMKYVINGGGTINQFATNSSTIYGHANAEGAEAVGAAAYFQTPEFGASPPQLESFSSTGRTLILFDLTGASVNISRQKPEIVCADGGNTTFFGSDIEPDGFPNFFGTSAAAPHAAGIAALLLDLEPSTIPTDLFSALEDTAIDMNAVGIDDESGSGLCQADQALLEIAVTEISVTKTVLPTSIPEPGDSVTFTVRLDNTGNTGVEITSLNDDIHGDLNTQGDCTVPQTISVGEFYQCSFSVMVSGNAGATEIDTITAMGNGAGGTTTDSDTATVTITNVNPTISMSTIASPTSVVEPGESVTFTVQVSNTGTAESVDLTALIDDIHGNLNGQGNCILPQTIATGSFYQCNFSATVNGNAGDSQTNTVTATAEDDESNTANANDSATVTVTDVLPTISMSATATPTSVVEPGESVTFTVQINNTGAAESLDLIVLIDDSHGNLNGQGNCVLPQTIATSSFYQCSFSATVNGNSGDIETNTITATAEDDENNSVNANNSATVTVTDVLPTITVNNTATITSVTEPSGSANFVIRVDNTGTAESINLISLIDDIHGDLNGLSSGNCVLPQIIVAGGFYQCDFNTIITGNAGDSETNTVTATAQDDELNSVNANDSATIVVTDVLPTITISNTASPISVSEPGGLVTFTVQVNNTGTAESVNLISLIDNNHGNLNGQGDCVIPQLISTGNFYQCSFNATVNGSFGDTVTNTITATAEDDELNSVNANDSATVTITDLIFRNGFEAIP